MTNENSNSSHEADRDHANKVAAGNQDNGPTGHGDSQKEALRQECDQLKDRLARSLAEFQNFRKQAEKRHLDLRKFVLKDLVYQILPIVDSFQAARAALDQGQNVEQVKEGVKFIHEMLVKFLTDNRVEPILATGQVFNPEEHEAVTCESTSEFEPNRVIRELLRGYRVDDMVVRHARVAVAVAPPEAKE